MAHSKYAIFLLICFTCADAQSAAWTQSKGTWQAILTSNTYESSDYFDSHGNKKDAGVIFNKTEVNPFVEYGVRDDITIGVNPNLQYWRINGSLDKSAAVEFRGCGSRNILLSNQSSGEIVESEFFLRKKVWERGNAIFSVQPLVKTPCLLMYEGNTEVQWNTYAVEMRALAGYGFKWDPALLGTKMRPFAGQYHFADVEVAYRKRPGELSDQIKIDSTLGFRFNPEMLLLLQEFAVFSVGDEYIGRQQVTPSVYRDNIDSYADIKLQVSGVVQATRSSSLQIGYYNDVYGRNYGAGQGAIISWWIGF